MKGYKLKFGEFLELLTPQVEDAKAINDYIFQVSSESVFLSFTQDEFKTTIEEQIDRIKRFNNTENELMLKAVIDGKIVGLLSVHSTYKKRGKHVGIFGISILKEHWSKGIGRLLLEEMIFWAKENPIIRKLNLSVQENNYAAINLYKKVGFKVEGVDRNASFENNRFYDLIQMGLFFE